MGILCLLNGTILLNHLFEEVKTIMRNNRYLIALAVALGMIPIMLDSTIVVIALTPIRKELNTDVNTAQWIITGFFLANAAVVSIGGYLAKQFGRKRILLLGITIFTIGSVLCGIAPGIGWLIAFRVLQGIGGGILLPIGPALAFDVFPQEERAKASAVIGVPILIAPVFGPILGGYLNDTLDWHSIFFVNLPVGILAIILAFIVIPSDKPRESRNKGFDYIGLSLSIIGIMAVVYAFKIVTQTNPDTVTAANPGGDLYGWGHWLVWVLFGTGIFVLALFSFYSLRISSDPALDLSQLGKRNFLVSSLITWASAIVSFGLMVLLPLYFESVRLPNLSALDTGIALVPFGLSTIVGTIVATALYRAIGPRWVVLAAVALSILSAFVLAQTIHPTMDAGQLFTAAQDRSVIPSVAGPEDLRWGIFLVGMSFAMMNISVQTLALEAFKGDALDKASSLLLSTKFIFSSIGVAIITTLFIDNTRSQSTDIAGQLQTVWQSSGSDKSVLVALKGIQPQIVTQAGTWAIQHIFWLIFFSSFPLVLLTLLLPGKNRQIVSVQEEKQ
jgi:DHA2 family multidrug resistance protein